MYGRVAIDRPGSEDELDFVSSARRGPVPLYVHGDAGIVTASDACADS